jgi:hypothetical protein
VRFQSTNDFELFRILSCLRQKRRTNSILINLHILGIRLQLEGMRIAKPSFRILQPGTAPYRVPLQFPEKMCEEERLAEWC